MSELIIRQIKKTELNQLLSLYQHMHEEDDPLPDFRDVDHLWHRICDNPLLVYLGGFIEDRLVNSCNLSIIPNLTRGCRPFGLVENVVTHKDYRNKGFGQEILNHTKEIAWEHKCYKLLLMTGRKTDSVINFYKNAGFDPDAKQGFVCFPEGLDFK